MPFAPFHELCPEVGIKETRSVTVPAGSNLGLPPAEYGFLEMYCDEPGCDCRRVMFYVMSTATGKLEAVVAWGWESREFYGRWLGFDDPTVLNEMKGPVLNLGSPQTQNSASILRLASNVLLNDPVYVERLRRHYAMFRDQVDRSGQTPQRNQWVSKPQPLTPKMAAARRKLKKKRRPRGNS